MFAASCTAVVSFQLRGCAGEGHRPGVDRRRLRRKEGRVDAVAIASECRPAPPRRRPRGRGRTCRIEHRLRRRVGQMRRDAHLSPPRRIEPSSTLRCLQRGRGLPACRRRELEARRAPDDLGGLRAALNAPGDVSLTPSEELHLGIGGDCRTGRRAVVALARPRRDGREATEPWRRPQRLRSSRTSCLARGGRARWPLGRRAADRAADVCGRSTRLPDRSSPSARAATLTPWPRRSPKSRLRRRRPGADAHLRLAGIRRLERGFHGRKAGAEFQHETVARGVEDTACGPRADRGDLLAQRRHLRRRAPRRPPPVPSSRRRRGATIVASLRKVSVIAHDPPSSARAGDRQGLRIVRPMRDQRSPRENTDPGRRARRPGSAPGGTVASSAASHANALLRATSRSGTSPRHTRPPNVEHRRARDDVRHEEITDRGDSGTPNGDFGTRRWGRRPPRHERGEGSRPHRQQPRRPPAGTPRNGANAPTTPNPASIAPRPGAKPVLPARTRSSRGSSDRRRTSRSPLRDLATTEQQPRPCAASLHHQARPDVVNDLEPEPLKPGRGSNAARRTRLKAPVPIAFGERGSLASQGRRRAGRPRKGRREAGGRRPTASRARPAGHVIQPLGLGPRDRVSGARGVEVDVGIGEPGSSVRRPVRRHAAHCVDPHPATPWQLADVDHRDARIGRRKAAAISGRAIGRAIVDQHDLQVRIVLREQAATAASMTRARSLRPVRRRSRRARTAGPEVEVLELRGSAGRASPAPWRKSTLETAPSALHRNDEPDRDAHADRSRPPWATRRRNARRLRATANDARDVARRRQVGEHPLSQLNRRAACGRR